VSTLTDAAQEIGGCLQKNCGRGRHTPRSEVLALVPGVPVSPWCTEYVCRFSMRPVLLDPCRGNRCVDHQGEQKGVDERVVVGESVA
jgi:hypothetical protein